jgi:uncharacterized cupredoxin-like copper-binding protein
MTATLTETEVQTPSAPPPPEEPPSRKTRTRIVLPAALALAFALLVAIVLASGGDSKKKAATPTPAAAKPAPALGHAVGVSLTEFKVTPNATAAAAGKVTFTVRNAGAVKHEFVVIATSKPAGDLLKGAEADETGNAGEIGDVPPGTAKTLTLNLKAGHYALICNLPGHYQAGQHADFTVR